MKFATFVLFQYMGQRKFKLTVFMNDGIQLIVSHPQPNPNTAHDTVIILFYIYMFSFIFSITIDFILIVAYF
ncbi:hypothetical protein HanOQP8_Chr00c184g0783841 [Helianthus annuus]|nr:hypothetical protein HanHA89_Chr08g0292131 [Helianthus annuus]KAJ0806854.1 hypothetical protein HanOQP8_Chr00c184g0783841 [Helianthus annuus]